MFQGDPGKPGEPGFKGDGGLMVSMGNAEYFTGITSL
jgi:hypothetical protein